MPADATTIVGTSRQWNFVNQEIVRKRFCMHAVREHMRAGGNNTGRQILGRKTHGAHFSLDNI
jgi:hypothetical protein